MYQALGIHQWTKQKKSLLSKELIMLPLLQHTLNQQNSYTSWAQWGARHCSEGCSFHLPPKCIAPSPLWPQQSGYSLHTPGGHYSHSWWHPVSGEWISHHPRHRLHCYHSNGCFSHSAWPANNPQNKGTFNIKIISKKNAFSLFPE